MTTTGERLPKAADYMRFHPVLRVLSTLFSYVFHPLFIPLYIVYFLVYEIGLFSQLDPWHKVLIMISMFVIYTLLPLVSVLLCKGLGFIQSVYLKTPRDRIIPYVICEIFYFWGWYVSRNLGYPKEMIEFQLAIFLASCLGLIFNAYSKVSMHAISLGVACGFMVLLGFRSDINYGLYISIVLLAAGFVCTSRLILLTHTPSEIYNGLLIGAIAQGLGYLFGG